MTCVFDQLPQVIQDRLASAWPSYHQGQHHDALVQAAAKYLRQHDEEVMLHACKCIDLDAVQSLLNLGMDPNGDTTNARAMSPLFTVINTIGIKALDETSALALVDVLLAKGADPNRVISGPSGPCFSAMHWATCLPEVVSRLLAAGGDPKLRTIGTGTLLDAWFSTASRLAPERQHQAMQALDILVQHGLPTRQVMNDGANFLMDCWACPELRPLVPRLLDLGFDPLMEGTMPYLGGQSQSLRSHLEKIAAHGNACALGLEILSRIQAEELSMSVPQATSHRTLARP